MQADNTARNIGISNSSEPTFHRCQAEVTEFQELFYLCSLGPAIFIVLVLGFLSKRKSCKKQSCNGQPGLVIPLDFFCGQKNRMSIAIAFGATAGNCLSILWEIDIYDKLPGPTWVQVFQKLLTVLHFGVINYPFLACLTTEHTLVGSSFGFIYSTIRFIVLMLASFKCNYDVFEGISLRTYLAFYSEIPVFICLFYLVVRFTVLLISNLRRILSRPRKDDQSLSEKFPLATQENFIHVEKLFYTSSARCSELQKPWYIRIRNAIYKPMPEFKFSTQMLSTVVVAALILYALLLKIAGYIRKVDAKCQTIVLNSSENNTAPQVDTSFTVVLMCRLFPSAKAPFVAATVLSAVLSIAHIGHMLACHRRNVYLLYHSNKLFFKGQVYSPARLVGRSLSYSGYQIAYIAWGFIIALAFLFVVIWIVALLVTMEKAKLKEVFFEIFIDVLPALGLAVFVWIFQFVLSVLVFRDRSFPDITITVNNRQLYCIAAYFFFFLNIIVGLFACIFRILKGALLGVVFLARIDRTSMIEGFYTWDPGYMAYLGHVYFYVAHHHPVLLVFCQLLMDSKKDRSEEPLESCLNEGRRGSEEGLGYSYAMRQEDNYGAIQFNDADVAAIPQIRLSSSRHERQVRVSQVGYNRWFLAWTLMKNPRLISLRSKRRSNSRPASVINQAIDYSDDQLLVG